MLIFFRAKRNYSRLSGAKLETRYYKYKTIPTTRLLLYFKANFVFGSNKLIIILKIKWRSY